ncbi:MAG: voltage-gated potassium channel [Solirubrobacteraceae bacterium]|nr:voltage-gated potassium channel [Solirubrobacteraceae bacterium]
MGAAPGINHPRGGPAGRDTSSRDAAPRRPRRRRGAFQQRAERAIQNGHVFRYLAGATALVSCGSGVLVWLVDRRDFHTIGDGVWWAIVTLATVGYGDIVPHTAWGRIVGSAVILIGVTFLALLTATVTSYFVSAYQEERAADTEGRRGADEEDTRALLHEIAARLAALEDAVRDDGPPGPPRDR